MTAREHQFRERAGKLQQEMLIHSYCYEDRNGRTGIFGPQDIDVLADWSVWRKALRCDVPAFLDMPGIGGYRIILLSIPDAGKIIFAVPLETVNSTAAVYALYKALEAADADTLEFAIATRSPFELRIADCTLEQPPLPIHFEDLDGLQLIGNTTKALSTVACMSSMEWADKFFLAVNPIEYRNEYTTIISEETPSGEWQKLSVEKKAVHAGKRFHWQYMTRQITTPRNFIILLLMLLLLILCLVWCRQKCSDAESRIRRLETENENLKYQLERKDDRIRILQESL